MYFLMTSEKRRGFGFALAWAALVVGVVGCTTGPIPLSNPAKPALSAEQQAPIEPGSAARPSRSPAAVIAATLAAINAFRSEHGLRPVAIEPRLAEAARDHARDMAKMQTMSHTGSDGSGFETRLARVCYPYMTAAENVAAGGADPAGVVARWIASPPHRQNLLLADVTDAGIGHANGFPGDPFRHYWALALGTARDTPDPCA